MTFSIHFSFAVTSLFVARYHPEKDVSALVAVEYSLQALACLQLLLHVWFAHSMKGISVKMLKLIACSRALRLCSTLWFVGYLPVGDTGVWVCQIADIASLTCVLAILRFSYTSLSDSCEKDVDVLPFYPLLLLCVVLGALFHGDLDENPVFDSLFASGLYAACLVPLAQIRMTVAQAIRAPQESSLALPLHFSVPLALSTVASYGFWRIAYFEIEAPAQHVVMVFTTILQPLLAWFSLVISTGYGNRAFANFVVQRCKFKAPDVVTLGPLLGDVAAAHEGVASIVDSV